MKDVEVYKKENEALRQEVATLKMQFKQLNASAQALDQSYGSSIREVQAAKTAFILKNEEVNELNAKLKELEEKLKPQVAQQSKAA